MPRTSSFLLALLAFAACHSAHETPTEADRTVITANLDAYLDAWERERATRTQATGEHPVAEQALRDLEDTIREHARGERREAWVAAIDARLRGLSGPDDPSGEALSHLRSLLAP